MNESTATLVMHPFDQRLRRVPGLLTDARMPGKPDEPHRRLVAWRQQSLK